jgi:uncharacterized protein (TIGR03118 family)
MSHMSQTIRHKICLTALLLVAVGAVPGPAFAQYTATMLATNKSPNSQTLINPWGLATAPGDAIWINDEGFGIAAPYAASGLKQKSEVAIFPASGLGSGTPTGIVANTTNEFQEGGLPTFYLYATYDGAIESWNDGRHSTNLAAIDINNIGVGAVYTGLAITNKPSGNYIYAADFYNNKVDVYDGTFAFVTSFTDDKLPAGFAPFGIRDIGGMVYVAFASTEGKSGGYLDVFEESGSFVKTLIMGAPLNHPWGIALAPSNFGELSNTLLVSNNTNTGTINGFDLTTGALVGTVSDSTGKDIEINQLWGIMFGGGSSLNGSTNQLFYTAGPKMNKAGVFGVINMQ